MPDETAIATNQRQGDEVTTTLGRKIIVGSVHRDEKVYCRWWIEPDGADHYTWWLPVSNVVQVNGRDTGVAGEGENAKTITTIWFPFWYEMDQSITVGQVADFDFFKVVPEYVAHDGLPVIYHGDWQEKCRSLFDRRKSRILTIRDSVLGQIRVIDTNGLDYTFNFCDGRCLKVEAEETRGLTYGRSEQIADWRAYVEIQAIEDTRLD